MFTSIKLFFTFEDKVHPDEFPRIISPSLAVSMLHVISVKVLLSRFSGVNGSHSLSSAAGANPNQRGGDLKALIFRELNRGNIIAVEARADRFATIGPFYVTNRGYLRKLGLIESGYPADRIIRRYEEMVKNYGRRAKPTIFQSQFSRTQEAQKVERARRNGQVSQMKVAEPMTKAERWQQRQYLIVKGERSPYPDAQLASKRLAKNNIAVEKAKLSENVYKATNPLNDTPDVPEGWKDISNDEVALKRVGLRREMLYDDEQSPDFLARTYQPDSHIFGKVMNTTVVFRGSREPEFAEGTGETVKKIFFDDISEIKNMRINSIEDWINNGAQAFGAYSEYYKKAVKIGKLLKNSSSVSFSGHSLGGGMASVASIASGNPAWTFNAAGVNPGTVEKYGGSLIGSPSTIQAYRVKGELLTRLQEVDLLEDTKSLNFNLSFLAAKVGISSLMPDAIGIKHTISGGTGSLLDKHGIDQAIRVIEEQKDDDIAIIRSRL